MRKGRIHSDARCVVRVMADIELGIRVLTASDPMNRTETAEVAIERIYDEYAKSLYRYALAVTSCPEDAEDAVQEVFVRLARSPRRLPRVANMTGYLFSSARNAAYDILRSRQRGERLSEALQSEVLGASAYAAPEARDENLSETMLGLPVDQREVLVLKVFDEMTFKEIAALLGVSINTAASRYRYAIAKLREALEAQDDGR